MPFIGSPPFSVSGCKRSFQGNTSLPLRRLRHPPLAVVYRAYECKRIQSRSTPAQLCRQRSFVHSFQVVSTYHFYRTFEVGSSPYLRTQQVQGFRLVLVLLTLALTNRYDAGRFVSDFNGVLIHHRKKASCTK